MNIVSTSLSLFYLAVNIAAFVTMWLDKRKARNGSNERISEGMMFFMATVFGSIGVYAGMFVCRHKTRKWYFLVGIPFLIVENCALLYVVYMLLNK